MSSAFIPSSIQPDPELTQYLAFTDTPSTPAEWIDRARQVGDALHLDEKARDNANIVPYRQVKFLKTSGLVTLLGPKSAGESR